MFVCLCGMLRRFLFSLCILALCNSEDTLSGKQGPFCSPAKCKDGTCYCSENNLGWWNLGAGQAFGSSNCYRAGRGECQCVSCGQASTQCLDMRCSDDGTEDSNGICYSTNSDGTKTRTNYVQYDYCYLKENPCQDCTKHGEHKVGCGKTSPGECKPCENKLESGKFWKAPGSCEQIQCSIPARGKYIQGECGLTTDAAIRDCTNFKYNQGVKNYYCPGNSDPRLAPSNSYINDDWSDFVCKTGFYHSVDQCVSCPAGSCCVNENIYDCPEHYYSSGRGNSICTKCTLACPSDKSKLMRKCDQNSIQTPTMCTSCGLCGKWPDTGYNCVTNPQDFSYLPSTCCGPTCLN